MGLFRNLGQKVERFKQEMESASQDTYGCEDCGEEFSAQYDTCPECGGEVVKLD